MERCPSEDELQAVIEGRSDSAATRLHLAGCEACGAVVALAGSETVSRLAAQLASANMPEPLVRGAQVGRYLVIDLIGSGGMGMVYSAFDPDLGRKVALKVLNPAVRMGTVGDEVR